MRALLLSCAFAVALAGCRGTRRETPTRAEKNAFALRASTARPRIDQVAKSVWVAAETETGDGVPTAVTKRSPNMPYAQLGRDACLAELRRRSISFEEAPPAESARRSRKQASVVEAPTPKVKRTTSAWPVSLLKKPLQRSREVKPAIVVSSPTSDEAGATLAPVRLRGPLHGITLHSALPEKKLRTPAPIEFFDCRLVLALDDFASVLREHEVVEVVHMPALRSPRTGGCTSTDTPKQPCATLAVDVGSLKKKDGSVLDIEKDFEGRIGVTTCTAGAGPTPTTPAATELWDIVCESGRRGPFHVILTASLDAERDNRVHLEITPDAGWTSTK
jgi:hypothetical protein